MKIWRKTSTQQRSHGSAHVDQDEIIGVTAIDLSSLSSESSISGYYNIVDTSGHLNGQIKVTTKERIIIVRIGLKTFILD